MSEYTTRYGLRVAINGSENDTHGNAWVRRMAKIKTSEGGGSFTQEASLVVLDFDLKVSLLEAATIRTICVAIECPIDDVATHGVQSWHLVGAGPKWYQIIFNGAVTAFAATKGPNGDDGWCSFGCQSEMAAFFQRRARKAAENNIGPWDVADDLNTAASAGIRFLDECVPRKADFYTLDVPDQKSASNGEWLRTAMAGTGMSLTADWDNTITSPRLCWHTDYAWPNDIPSGGAPVAGTMLNYSFINAGRPWLYEYSAVGRDFGDYFARIEVNGETGNTLSHAGWVRYPNLRHMGHRQPTKIIDISNGTRFYGWARQISSTTRTELSNSLFQVNTWIDSGAGCETAAQYLMNRTGEPDFIRMNRVGWWPDQLYNDAISDPDWDDVGGSNTVNDYAADHAMVMLGSTIWARNNSGVSGAGAFDDTDGAGGVNVFGTWPAKAGGAVQGDSGALYDDLESIWTYNTSGEAAYGVRSIWREWTPAGGWHIEVALEPYAYVRGIGGTNRGNGTY